MTPDLARLAAAGVGIGAETTPDSVGQLLADWMGYMAKLRDLDKQVRRMVIGWCEETRLNVPAGDGSYWYPAHKTEKSCDDVAAVLDAILEHSGGDWDAVKACLAANAWKPGACEAVLPAEVFAKLFTVEKKTTLKDGGKAEKQLVKADPQFTKQRPRHGAVGQGSNGETL